MNKAVFLDLNGTLIPSVTYDEPVSFDLIPGVIEAIAQLANKGFFCPVVTIQSRIGKGIFTEKEFLAKFNDLAKKMQKHKAYIQGPYVCPHSYGINCHCRKPSSFLFQKAAQDFKIDLKNSYVIGDSVCDIVSAVKFGGYGCLVKSSEKRFSKNEINLIAKNSAFIGNSINEIVDWVIDMETRSLGMISLCKEKTKYGESQKSTSNKFFTVT